MLNGERWAGGWWWVGKGVKDRATLFRMQRERVGVGVTALKSALGLGRRAKWGKA